MFVFCDSGFSCRFIYEHLLLSCKIQTSSRPVLAVREVKKKKRGREEVERLERLNTHNNNAAEVKRAISL